MERLEVVEVLPAVDAVAPELVLASDDDLAFGSIQIDFGRATEEVAQGAGGGVEVGVVGQRW